MIMIVIMEKDDDDDRYNFLKIIYQEGKKNHNNKNGFKKLQSLN